MLRSTKLWGFSIVLLLAILSRTIVNCEINGNKTNSENLTSSMSCKDDEKCKAIVRDQLLLVQKFDDYIRETSSIISARHIERLKHTSVIYGLVVAAADEKQLNQQCYNEIMQIYHGINRKEIWAVKSELKDFVLLGKKAKNVEPLSNLFAIKRYVTTIKWIIKIKLIHQFT